MFVRVKDGKAEKYTLTKLFADNPNTSFRSSPTMETLAEYGVFPVEPIPVPEFDDHTQRVVEGAPKKVDGRWVQTWEVIDLTEDELNEKAPAAVTMCQFRIALSRLGLLDNMIEFVSVMDEEFQIRWEYDIQVERTSPFVVALTSGSLLDAEEVRSLFHMASGI